jgi:hypothetical protein
VRFSTVVAALCLGCAGTAPSTRATPSGAPPSANHTQPPASDALARALMPSIEKMVAPELRGAPVRIVATAGPVRGWVAAAVSPPYREFPTVIFFRAAADGSWSRVFEGLIPGVQGQRTSLLDLHTRGQAFDYTVGPDDAPVTPELVPKILALAAKNHLSTVVHAYFFHSHPAGPEPYFVDRRDTYAIAKRLLPGEYESYPRAECTMFDIPETERIFLTEGSGALLLTAETANGQRWAYSWTDVDERGLLVGKTVDAR